jgi:hypothetical protein
MKKLALTPVSVLAILAAAPVAVAQEPPAFPTTQAAEGAKSATVTAEGITATVELQRRLSVDPTMDVPVLTVTVGGQMVQEVLGTPPGFDFLAAEASIAEIDPGNDMSEVFFSSFTGGAHCCNEIYVVTERGSEWVTVSVGSFDGGGPMLRDADGDGVAEIIAVDNSFLYQFDSYAGSAAPRQILAVEDGEVADVTREPRFLAAHQEWLAEIESWAPGEDRWTMPGWIAGWVATKILVGQGAEAWEAFEDNWDPASDPGFEICLDGGDAFSCAPARVEKVSFPEALRAFLEEHDYPLGDAAPAPAAPAPAEPQGERRR